MVMVFLNTKATVGRNLEIFWGGGVIEHPDRHEAGEHEVGAAQLDVLGQFDAARRVYARFGCQRTCEISPTVNATNYSAEIVNF